MYRVKITRNGEGYERQVLVVDRKGKILSQGRIHDCKECTAADAIEEHLDKHEEVRNRRWAGFRLRNARGSGTEEDPNLD